jgi:hypothetical protein
MGDYKEKFARSKTKHFESDSGRRRLQLTPIFQCGQLSSLGQREVAR